MKRAAAILLVMMFAFQSVGVFLLFQVRQQVIRREIRAQIRQGVPQSELVLLKFDNRMLEHPPDGFRWMHDDEFRYHGRLYDIVEKHPGADSTVFHCIPDEKENLLFAGLNRLVRDELEQEGRQSDRQVMPLSWSFDEVPEFDFNVNAHPEGRHFFYRFITINWQYKPLYPPPKSFRG